VTGQEDAGPICWLGRLPGPQLTVDGARRRHLRGRQQMRAMIAAVLGHDELMGPVLPSAMVAESAVLVPLPEAERVVGSHRDRLDRATAWGVPAHVTVLKPFAAPSAITTAATIAGLADAVGSRSIGAFDCEFTATGWFGEEVLWLALQPDEPFRVLTQTVSAAFP
jgi:hypothetical protein